MRSQKGLGGAKLNLSPSFLLVPPSLENTTYVLLNSSALPEKYMSAAVYNPWNDSRVTPIVEQRLEPASGPRPWYLVASPAQVSTIEVAYLYGNDAPEITEEMSFRTDAFTYKQNAGLHGRWHQRLSRPCEKPRCERLKEHIMAISSGPSNTGGGGD